MPVEVRKAIDGEILQRGYVREDVLWFLAVSKYHATGWLKQGFQSGGQKPETKVLQDWVLLWTRKDSSFQASLSGLTIFICTLSSLHLFSVSVSVPNFSFL